MSDETPPPAAYAAGNDPLERVKAMIRFTPQAAALGMEVTRIEPARVWGRVPYRPDLVGDPETGVIAGGVLTTLLDTICGMAAVAAMESPTTVATIDLRIDYMRAAEPGRDVLAEAHCYKLGRSIAFVRAVAYEDSPDNPIAHVACAFMVNSSAGRKFGANVRKKT
ncbi:MAG TPA: PaaI family thioesterase [Vitreimonas sp.]|uniref:PaaI family thioesterase n=1 Tax=Vitreimonas sp. TaxID=3069702 RepID=UPI002D2818A6|nr:PaaI family thioesterase [Vitreimonas sp.]HYD86649.1 PaaI family thioesterase [Vitreimonas sp.]